MSMTNTTSMDLSIPVQTELSYYGAVPWTISTTRWLQVKPAA